ncbi:hypothetical protein [Paenibacillus sp. 1P07SE]|uniref:hypothetical protein n=1 Tax=Paenibacillus sp. 1P07SE TaxID=3132209 RepID=UPI0039A64C10
MKKWFAFTLVMVLIMSFATAAFALSPEEQVKQRASESNPALRKNVVNDGIAAELQRIAEEYEVGEALSPEDAEFIKKHAPIRFNEAEVEKDGKTVTIAADTDYFEGYNNNGLIDAGLQVFFQMTKGTINHSLRTYMLAYDRDGTTRPRITNSMNFSGYGFIGTDGVIGKVVDFTQSNSCTNRSDCTMDQTTPFTGIMIYGYAAPVSQIFYSAGTDANSVTISTVTPW